MPDKKEMHRKFAYEALARASAVSGDIAKKGDREYFLSELNEVAKLL